MLNEQGQATPILDGRDEVFAAWLQRDTATPSTAAAATQSNGVSVGLEENVSELDTVVRGNKDLITIGADYRGGGYRGADYRGVATEGVATDW